MNGRVGEARSEGVLKHFFLAFCLALLCYVSFYSCDRHLRLRKGPWSLTFTNEDDGTPSLVINQHAVGITNVVVQFVGESVTLPPTTVSFWGPGVSVPFGEVIFFDTTYLPGTVTFDLYGHKVELLRRTMVINFKEHAWQSGEVISLSSDQKWETVAATNAVSGVMTNQVPQVP